jgi:hypothetical protein
VREAGRERLGHHRAQDDRRLLADGVALTQQLGDLSGSTTPRENAAASAGSSGLSMLTSRTDINNADRRRTKVDLDERAHGLPTRSVRGFEP